MGYIVVSGTDSYAISYAKMDNPSDPEQWAFNVGGVFNDEELNDIAEALLPFAKSKWAPTATVFVVASITANRSYDVPVTS